MIPEPLKALRQWVCAENGSKAPMKAWEHVGASTSDPTTWTTYEEAALSVSEGLYDNVGFVFANNGIVGIDIDTGYDEDGLLSREAADILSACDSYTERSRSGRGFHVLLRGYLPFDGKNNQAGIEIYQAKRYFILTGDTVLDREEIVENQDAIDYVVETYFADQLRASPGSLMRSVRIYNPEWSLPKDNRVKLRPVYPRITPGSRNLCMTSLAGMLYNLGYSEAQILEELTYANRTACDPELDARELRSIVKSVTRYKR